MQINKKIQLLLLGLSLLVPSAGRTQVLEAMPDEGRATPKSAINESAELRQSFDLNTESHISSAMSGSSGLITIPTPDFAERSTGVSYKKTYVKSSIVVNNTKVNLEKDEFIAGIRAKINPNLEASISRFKYIRASNPGLTGLNFDKEHFGFGMKYSTRMTEHDICLGFNFTPMSAEELNLADIEQIETLRNVYVTMSEKIGTNLNGYLGLSSAFTKKQQIDFGNGIVQKINRKDMLISSVGLEYNLSDAASIFGEAKFGNYRDIFKEDSVRHRIHAGIRFGVKNLQLEMMALNVTEDNPTTVFGGSIGF